MATWKKILVSGSNAHLASVTASGLTNDNLVIAGTGGALESSGLTFDGSTFDIGSSSITSTGASSIISGSFSGSFVGDGSGLTGITATSFNNSLIDGNGIVDFSFDGSTQVSVAVELSGSTLTVGSSGVAVNAGGITTTELANDSVTADKLDDVFTDGGGVAGTFGSATQVPVLNVDGQGRLTSASLANIASTLAISGSTSGNDTVSLIDDALTITGAGGITSDVTNNTVTIGTADSGFVSSSVEGDAQGQIKFNGVNVDVNALGSGDSPTFAAVTTTGNVEIGGDLIVTGDTIQAQVTNLLVEDRFILLNSGSANPDEGGLIIDEGSGTGHALIFEADAGIARWGFNQSVDSTATTANTTAYASAVVDLNNVNHSDSVEYQKNGNIKVDTNGDIFIYA